MYKTLNSNAQITYFEVKEALRQVEKYRTRLQAKGLSEVTLPFKEYSKGIGLYYPYLDGVEITITIPLADDSFKEYIVFKWKTPDGREMESYVTLATLPNNLGNGRITGYFLCPVTNRLCRKLYTDGLIMCSRFAFESYNYTTQKVSGKSRIAQRLQDAARKREEAELHNQTYKGEPTRWAIKLNKWATIEERYTVQAINHLSYLTRRAGRKRGKNGYID